MWLPVYTISLVFAFVCCMVCCVGILAASGTEVEALNNTEAGRAINTSIRQARASQGGDIESRGDACCPICTVNFAENDDVAQCSCPQRHVIHKTCANEWFKVNNQCPYCYERVAG